MKNFIPISQPSITQKEIDYVTDAVKSGWVSSLGKYINLFEEGFAEYCNEEFIRALARIRGVQINTQYAETFEVLRWIIQ